MRNLRVLAATVLVLSLAGMARAQITTTWIGPVGDNNWSTGANWNNGVPGTGDTAVFKDVPHGVLLVTVDGPTSVGTINMNNLNPAGQSPSPTFGGVGNTLTVETLMNLDDMTYTTIDCNLAGAGVLDVLINGHWGTRYLKINNSNQMTGGMIIAGQGVADIAYLNGAGSGGGTPGTKAPITISNVELRLMHANAVDNVSQININAGGQLYHHSDTIHTLGTNIVSNGGTYYWANWSSWGGNAGGYSGTMTLTGNLTLKSYGYSTADIMTISGQITGAGKLIVNPGHKPPQWKLTNAANNFVGLDILSGGVIFTNATALGTGAVSVAGDWSNNVGWPVCDNNHGLAFVNAAPVAPTPPITVNPGGLVKFSQSGRQPAPALVYDNLNLTVAGGVLGGPGIQEMTYSGADDGAVTLASGLSVTADSYVWLGTGYWSGNNPAGDFTITGAISGAGKLTVITHPEGTASKLILQPAAGNSFSGGVEVRGGIVEAAAAGALGTGSVLGIGGGVLRNTAAGAFASVTGPITIQDGSGLELVNDDTASTYYVKPGGALIDDGTTTLTYVNDPAKLGVTGNIVLDKGAILGDAVVNKPASKDDLGDGDGGYGVFKGTVTGVHSVGTASGTLYRGLALMGGTAVLNATVTEAAGGTEGVGFLAVPFSSLEFNASSIVTTVGSNSVKLYGANNTFKISNDSNITAGKIEALGSSTINLSGTSSLTHDLEIKGAGSKLEMTADDALDATAWPTATLYAGTMINILYRNPSTGAIVVKAGAAAHQDYISGPDHGWGGANWTFEKHGQFFTYCNVADDGNPLIGSGKADYIIHSGRDLHKDVVLNGTRIISDGGGSITGADRADGTTPARLVLDGVPGATEGNISAERGKTTNWRMQVRFPTAQGTGILSMGDDRTDPNDPDTSTFYGATSRTVGVWKTYYTDGTVYWERGTSADITQPINQRCQFSTMSDIDVKSGHFYMRNDAWGGSVVEDYIRTAKTFRLGHGADFQWGSGMPTLATVFKGHGTAGLDVWHDITLRPMTVAQGYNADGTTGGQPTAFQQAGVAPGDSVGIFTFGGNLYLDNSEGVNPFVEIDILGGGGTGVQPVVGVDYDRVVVGYTVNGIGNADLVVNIAGGLVPADFEAGDEFTILTTTSNLTGLAFANVTWNGGAGNVEYGSGYVKLLNVTIRIPGDADLNGYVDLPDLILLARNWKVTPATWGQGDFDGDTIVDLPDLILLARNWHAGTPPPAGGAVPEPASLVLLALGGLALVRRRSRR